MPAGTKKSRAEPDFLTGDSGRHPQIAKRTGDAVLLTASGNNKSISVHCRNGEACWRLSNMQFVKDRKTLVGMLPKGGTVAEIGVQRGRFARHIYRRANPRRLHLIDCWEHQNDDRYDADSSNVSDFKHNQNFRRTRQRLRRGIRRNEVFLHKGYSVPVLSTFEDGYFDWVYIDANHTYEGVLADLEASLPKVRPGGLICGHDYTDTPAWQAANFGVVQAVHEFCGRHQWQIICITQELQDPKSRDNPSFVLRHASLSDDVFTKSAWWRKFMP